MTYPRDMKGYGRAIPDPKWPGGAHVAVQFVLNYEEGGENNILHGDAASEAFLSEIVGAAAWPGQRHWNMESIYEYGARAGFWRLWRMFTGRRVPLTIYGVATAMMRSPDQVEAMKEAGWEIASHGLKWVEHKDMPEEVERAADCRGDPHPHASHRREALGLVHRALLDEHHEAGDGGGRLPLFIG
jgi:peptidoglycan/xylan/chitin deacetylase (PgdA/CDA1 family)